MSLDTETLNSSHWYPSGVFIVNFEQVITRREYIFIIWNYNICVFHNTGNYTVISDNNTSVLTMKVILLFKFLAKYYQTNHKQDWIFMSPYFHPLSPIPFIPPSTKPNLKLGKLWLTNEIVDQVTKLPVCNFSVLIRICDLQ